MRKRLPSLTRQLEILGIHMLVGCCAQPTMVFAGQSLMSASARSASLVQPDATALPTNATKVTGIESIDTTGSTMAIKQNASKAVIHWGSFDIGSDATVSFVQPGTSAKVLNRVTGTSPSQIYGNLNANGQVYIINQNGILFGSGSQINVHSLTASALNIKFEKDISQYTSLANYDKQFVELDSFYDGGSESYQLDSRLPSTADAAVTNQGDITGGNLGSVALIGPKVTNQGTIAVESGDVALLAGDTIALAQDEFGVFQYRVTNSAVSGTATNGVGGEILTNTGNANMYGTVVNQDGLIRATTALEKNGRINLVGTKQVKTGAASVTETPITSSTERKIVDESTFKKGEITISSTQGSVEHYGAINNPSGTVNITAKNRIYLESGSSIDVSGSWSKLSADDRIIEVTLNSEELKDSAYKSSLLKGETVEVDILNGLDFADISGYLDGLPKSAAELTTSGGTIQLLATGDNSEVIVKQNAVLDFSGGGVVYGSGIMEQTMVRIGSTWYSLANIPDEAKIAQISSKKIKTHLAQYTQGDDAGTLWLNSRKVVLDGKLDGSVTRGMYQTLVDEDVNDAGDLLTVGRRIPRAGTLQIGQTGGTGNLLVNNSVDAVVVSGSVTPTTITAEDNLADYTATLDTLNTTRVSEISAEVLNNAGIGTLLLYPNQSITLAEDAHLSMAPLGSVEFTSQQIDIQGSMRLPSGSVTMTLAQTEGGSATVKELQDRILLDDDSVIDVSGLRQNNATATSTQNIQLEIVHNDDEDDPQQVNKGGSVQLVDANPDTDDEILLATGSTINVNGGFIINRDGSISAGDAGSISLVADRVQTAATLSGLALEGKNGGSLSIHTGSITFAASAVPLPAGFDFDDQLPESMRGHLVLGQNNFANSGFTQLSFTSIGDLVVDQGVSIAPSAVRIKTPVLTRSGYNLSNPGLVNVSTEYFGDSSLSLAAGKALGSQSLAGAITVAKGTTLSAGPAKGKLSLEGDSISLAGRINAPGGKVSITANNGDVLLASTASINAAGTALIDWKNTIAWLGLNYSAVDGGSVSLSGNTIILEEGSSIDVSGSGKVTNKTLNRRGKIVSTSLASAAGSVAIDYATTFTNKAQLLAKVAYSWLSGGSFSLAKTTRTTLSLQEEQIAQWVANGFTDLSFSSLRAIDFIESATDTDNRFVLAAASSLSLNASALIGTENQDIWLSAPWIRLTNMVEDTDGDTYSARAIATLSSGTATLNLAGEFIDLQGNIGLSGFDQTTLQADQALRLYDYYYSVNKAWSGALRTMGDLTIKAGVVYPAMHHSVSESETSPTIFPTAFTLSAGTTNAQGTIISGKGRRITILPSGATTDEDIYSAGGQLTLQAGDIDIYGTLTAPMGEIILKADESIHLYEGASLSTRGEDLTLFGTLVEEKWTVGGYLDPAAATNGTASYVPVSGAPEKSVAITAPEIIQEDGSVIDVGGGGSVFAYQFLPGYDGTTNPLAASNRYVILSDNSVSLPGATVYLEGMAGLATGTYTLLPAEYAFLPGAIIIEATGDSMLSGETLKTALGYTVVAGYLSDSSITTASPLREGFIIRTASEVLDSEGNFDTSTAIAGDAGSVTIAAGSGHSRLAGTILGEALSGYSGGALTLGATKLFLGLVDTLAADADYNLVFDVEELRGRGLRQLTVGGSTTTNVTFGAGSTLQGVSEVDVVASNSISLEEGAQVKALAATGQKGSLSLTTTTLSGAANSLLQASNSLELNLSNFNNAGNEYQGSLRVDDGSFTLRSKNIALQSEQYSGSKATTGAYLSSSLLQAISGLDAITLQASNTLSMLGNVDFHTAGELTLDSARIIADSSTAADVHISAGTTLSLTNSGSASQTTDASDAHAITLAADTIVFDGAGTLLFDTFNAIHFASDEETIFKGTGMLSAKLTNGQEMTFSASRFVSDAITTLTTNADGSSSLSLTPSNYTVDAAAGSVRMSGNGTAGGSYRALPGSLSVKGNSIALDNALFELPGGTLNLAATGDLSVHNSQLLAKGGLLNFPVTIGTTTYNNTFTLDGGQISLSSTNGTVAIDQNSTLDTSASSGIEGGSINLAAAVGGIDLAGTIRGDKLSYDSVDIDDFGTLATTIAGGGFSQLVDLRARSGNVAIDSGDTITTNQFILSADQGAIDIAGTIDASGSDGGSVEIWAKKSLTLTSTGTIKAAAKEAEGNGGKVLLASASDGVVTEAGSLIDVSGGTEGRGGKVELRASRDAIIAGKMDVDGDIQGAEQAIVRAVKTYTDTTITSSDVTTYKNDINTAWSALMAKQANWLLQEITIVPEVEVVSSGNLSIASGLSDLQALTTQLRGGTPGVLTFRAAGNLTVSSDIIDAPQKSLVVNSMTGEDVYVPISDGQRDSWDLNFIAGSDTTSARLQEVKAGSGNLTIGSAGNGKLVYTESGDINFASGANTTIYAYTGNSPFAYMPGTDTYNLASFDGSIHGTVGGNLALNGGIIQTAVSDINVQVAGNIDMGSTSTAGAIRTTGRAPLASEVPFLDELVAAQPWLVDYLDSALLERYWQYQDDGNIVLTAGGNITSKVVSSAAGDDWEYAYDDQLLTLLQGTEHAYQYGANYGVSGGWFNGATSENAASGIVTMAGGDITLKGKNIVVQTGAFGEGDVEVSATGNLSGRFLAADGDMTLKALGNVGTTTDTFTKDTLVELGSGSLTIQALGSVSLGTINNTVLTSLLDVWNLTYTADSSVTIHSALGNVVLSGNDDFAGDDSSSRFRLLPGSLHITAAEDIRLTSKGDFIMAPSATGQLELIAGGDIDGKVGSSTSYWNSGILMSSADPASVYGEQSQEPDLVYGTTANTPLHSGDTTPVLVTAGGDIANLALSVPKKAIIKAEGDIREITYWGQNLEKSDVSLISAGGDIIQQPYSGINNDKGYLGIFQAGHGALLVLAGGSIDLGSTQGIQSTGNVIGENSTTNINGALFDEDDKDKYGQYKGADLTVIAGYDFAALDDDSIKAIDKFLVDYNGSLKVELQRYRNLLSSYQDALAEKESLEEGARRLKAVIDQYYALLNSFSQQYSSLMATGNATDKSEAADLKQDMLTAIINPLLKETQSGTGDILMTQSVIKTTSGQDSLNLLAAGQIDVGATIISDNEDTSLGLLTEAGGDINVFAQGDINVNESRVVTFFGGDIFLLSNQGDINAGRGSTTVVSVSSDGTTEVGGKRVSKYTAPAPGSGIRTSTADLDGDGPLPQPEQGDAILIAWDGVIDAGEAGISAGKLTLAANQVLNAQNISFSDGGVGVPAASDVSISFSPQVGASAANDAKSTTQSIGQQLTDTTKDLTDAVSKMAEDIVVKMLVFEFLGFSGDSNSTAE